MVSITKVIASSLLERRFLAHEHYPVGFKVVKVGRIENLSLWRRYFNERELMKGQQHAPTTSLKTQRSWWYDDFHLDATVNEALLFHGTKAPLVPFITRGGFEDRIAELRGFFGPLLLPFYSI